MKQQYSSVFTGFNFYIFSAISIVLRERTIKYGSNFTISKNTNKLVSLYSGSSTLHEATHNLKEHVDFDVLWFFYLRWRQHTISKNTTQVLYY
jgi:hypothetical protein